MGKLNLRRGLKRITFVLSILGAISAALCSLASMDGYIRNQKEYYEDAKTDYATVTKFWDAWDNNLFKDKYLVIKEFCDKFMVTFDGKSIPGSTLFPYPFLSEELLTMPSNLVEEQAALARKDALGSAWTRIVKTMDWGTMSSAKVALFMIFASLTGLIIGFLSVWGIFWYGGLAIYSFFKWIANGFIENAQKSVSSQNPEINKVIGGEQIVESQKESFITLLDNKSQPTKTENDTMPETLTEKISPEKDTSTNKDIPLDENLRLQKKQKNHYRGIGRIGYFWGMLGIFAIHTIIKFYYGGMGRIAYFLGTLSIGGAYAFIKGDPLYAPQGEPVMTLTIGIISIILLIVITVSRMRNITMNPWLSLLMPFPIVSIIVGITCLVRQQGYVETKKLDTAGRIIAGIVLVFSLVITTVLVISASS